MIYRQIIIIIIYNYNQIIPSSYDHYYPNWHQSVFYESKSGIASFWVTYFFRDSSFYGELLLGKKQFVWETYFKLPLAFITFMNFKGACFVEGFLHNLWPCLGIAFTKCESTRNEYVEIVAVAERYFILTDVQNNESKMFWIKTCF